MPRLVWVLRRMALVIGALAALALAAPGAMAVVPVTGQVNVNIVSTGATAGMTYDSSTQTWAPDGSVDPATLNVSDFSADTGDVTVTTTSTGMSTNDPGTIDLQADPAAAAYVEFVPGSSGNIKIDTPTVTGTGPTFDGPVTLGEDTSISGDDFFGDRIDGAHSLTLPDGASITGDIGDVAPPSRLTSDEAARALRRRGHHDGSAGLQGGGFFNGASFVSTGTAASANITFDSTLTGAKRPGLLKTEADGTTTFDGAVQGAFQLDHHAGRLERREGHDGHRHSGVLEL